jgi:hypothetical protein
MTSGEHISDRRVTWPAVVEQWDARVTRELEYQVRYQLDDIAARGGDGPVFKLGNTVGQLSEFFARAGVLHGADGYAWACAQIAPYLPRAIEQAERLLAEDPGLWTASRTRLLSLFNAYRCCGQALPRAAEDDTGHWLSGIAIRIRGQSNAIRLSAACAAVTSTHPISVTAFVPGGNYLPKTMKPGQTFGADLLKLLRYLATAVITGAPAEAVRPAWRSYLEAFPAALAHDPTQTRWEPLLWCAYIMQVRFEQRPAGTVADELSHLVRSLP